MVVLAHRGLRKVLTVAMRTETSGGIHLEIMEIRPEDLVVIREILHSTGMFTKEEEDIGVELAEKSVIEGFDVSGYQTYVAVVEGETVPAGFTCIGPTPMTAGTFDMYWLVVHPRMQGKKIGRALVDFAAEKMVAQGGYLMIVETAGRNQYYPTRKFYENTDFTKISEIPDFYSLGDSKVTYIKRF